MEFKRRENRMDFMRHRLPPLNALRLFEASARLLSFKNAADELLLTPSAVSHGIQSLEQWLGVLLFTRTPKGLVLTRAGASYYPAVQAALEMLAENSARISSHQPRRHLRISAAPTFARHLLMPVLNEFQDIHPDIAVEIDTSQDYVDLDEDGADIAIRMGKGNWSGLVAEELLRETLVPVCAPQRRAEFAARDLEDLPLIHVTSVSEDWVRWAAASGRKLSSARQGLRFDTLQMAFDAAARGLGVAIGRRPLVDAELEAGRLVALWMPEVPCETAHWLVSVEKKANEPAVEALRTWIKSRRLGGHLHA